MKHTAKFLCVALSLVMLFAVNVPAMAEGETIYDARHSQNIFVLTGGNDEYYDLSTTINKTDMSSFAITDRVFETGFKLNTSGGKTNKDYIYLQVGNVSSYPILNAKFMYGSKGMNCVDVNGCTYYFDDGEWNNSNWNDIKFRVSISNEKTTEDVTYPISADCTVNMYVNDIYLTTFEYVYKPNTKSATLHYLEPYRLKSYLPSSGFVEGFVAYADDLYIGKYDPVKSFAVEETTVKAVKYKGFGEPNTVNVLFGTDDPENPDGSPQEFSVTWDELSGIGHPVAMTGTIDDLVYGSGEKIGSGCPVTATIEWLDLAYSTAINEGILTITKEASDLWDAKIYGATYVGNKLTAVELLAETVGGCQWTENNTATVDMKGHTRAFILDSSLRPLASN